MNDSLDEIKCKDFDALINDSQDQFFHLTLKSTEIIDKPTISKQRRTRSSRKTPSQVPDSHIIPDNPSKNQQPRNKSAYDHVAKSQNYQKRVSLKDYQSK